MDETYWWVAKEVKGYASLYFFKLIFIGIWLLYNVVLVSALQQSEHIYIYIYMSLLFLGFPSHLGHHRALSKFPELHSRFSLVIYFIRSIYMLISIQPTPPFPLLVSIHLFSIAKIWKQPKSFSIEKWIKMLYVYTMEYLSHKKECNWIICRDVDGPRRWHTEWNQKEKLKYHILMYIYESRKML